MVPDEHLARPTQDLRGELFPDLEHAPEVVMVRVLRLRFEPTVLDRRQRKLPGDRALFGDDCRHRSGDRGECGDGRVLEEVPRLQAQARLVRTGDDLNAENRLAAELEEVVVHSDPVDPQDLGPDPRECLFCGVPGRSVAFVGIVATKLRTGQRSPVQLAVRRERQALEHEEDGRDHVVRQTLPQGTPAGPDGVGGGDAEQATYATSRLGPSPSRCTTTALASTAA